MWNGRPLLVEHQQRKKEREMIELSLNFLVLTRVTSALELQSLERIQLDTVTPFLRHSRSWPFALLFFLQFDSNMRRFFVVIRCPPRVCLFFFIFMPFFLFFFFYNFPKGKKHNREEEEGTIRMNNKKPENRIECIPLQNRNV